MDDIEDMKIQLLGLADMSRLSREINVAVQSITNIRLPNHERHNDGSSCVGRAADSRTDRSFCVNRAAECASTVTTCPAPMVRPSTSCVDSADGTTGSLRCELPLPCARPLCAASTMAEVVANPTPFRTVTRRRSRRDPPASDDAGTSRPATNKTKKPAHIIGSGESRLSGGI